MRLKLVLWAVPLLLAGLAPAAAQDAAAVIARGKYLVEGVGVCQDCHTPRLENGELNKSKWMKGAVQNITPLKPIPNWHKTSPDLTPSGLLFKKWGAQSIIDYLQNGKNPKGNFAGPPMPPLRLSRDDAVAVVEYLKTLP